MEEVTNEAAVNTPSLVEPKSAYTYTGPEHRIEVWYDGIPYRPRLMSDTQIAYLLETTEWAKLWWATA